MLERGQWRPFTGTVNITISGKTDSHTFTYENIAIVPNSYHHSSRKIPFDRDDLRGVTVRYEPLDKLALTSADGIAIKQIDVTEFDYRGGWVITEIYCVKDKHLSPHTVYTAIQDPLDMSC